MIEYDNFNKDLARTIRDHRKKSGLSIKELANVAGIGKKQLFDLEHGKKTVQLDTLTKVLHTLNIRIQLISPLQNVSEKTHEKR